MDVLINNAGSAPAIKNMRWMPDEQWDETVTVDPTAVHAAVLPNRLARGGGTIVTVSSLAGYVSARANAPGHGELARV